MAKKQILTRSEIEKDVINALNRPSDMSESSYKKWTIPCIIIGCLLAIIEFIYPIFILWFLLALVIFLIAGSIIRHFHLKRRIKKVSIDDYEIKTEVVANTTSESYVRGTGWNSERVNNYTLRFESGEIWRVPKDNYLWSEERPMSDFAIYRSSHRGDVFIVVVKKDTGDIAMVYHTEFFEYKE